uniref:T-complex protein 1 subunit delta n=1 Tax=Pinguiococcus pyrenoidosus TaxID=172671 RepID=A0A7R9U684_9STRA|mmetsp:Transcript_16591/g.63074  ORF Transcript_16591/g.63074 Transcript_16591/m.63074 type:complete len:544 (+) Transcript_16591:177-1808(+)
MKSEQRGRKAATTAMGGRGGGESLRENQKERDVRHANIVAARAIADAVRTSLGPRGMDKMIQKGDGEVIISNDGATIMSQMEVFHPTAKMLVELSKAQDIEAGDGTTSVVVIAGALLAACSQLLAKGIHPMMIADSFNACYKQSKEILRAMARPIDLNDQATLLDNVNTCLSSKVIRENTDVISPLCVEAILQIIDRDTATNVDLNDIKLVKQIGGTIDDTELVHGLVFEKGAKKAAGGPTSFENAKIGLIQFHLSAPKTDMENNVVVSDYAAMDRILREERKHILGLCKKIKKSGCNVLLIQKAILRDAYNDMSLHFLAKLGIMVITDIERNEVDFISRTLGLTPVAHVDQMTADKLGSARSVVELSMPGSNSNRVVKVTGIENQGKTMTMLLRGSNKLVLDEAERSVHDALCVLRSLVKERFMIAGGGAPETQLAVRLMEWSSKQQGMVAYCAKAYAEALEIIPYTLAENAGMNAMRMVTELRAHHKDGPPGVGINVRTNQISDMYEEHVMQPLLVSLSALGLATECVVMILKIDDAIAVR